MSQSNRKGNRVAVRQDKDGIQTQLEQIEEYSPYPSADFLGALNDIDPKLIDKVMAMAEEDLRHRHKLAESDLEELKRVNIANIAYDKRILGLFERGQWFAVASNFGLLIFAGFALWLGYPVVASSIIPMFIAILVVYVLRKSPRTPPPKE